MKGIWYKIILELFLEFYWKLFLELLTGIVSVTNHTKCVSLSNQK